jgi:uncharacterized protein YlxW (UPF0749 family)
MTKTSDNKAKQTELLEKLKSTQEKLKKLQEEVKKHGLISK